MRSSLLVAASASLALSLTVACGLAAPPERIGAVTRIGDFAWALTPSDQPTMRYCLDPAFKAVEGQAVRFSGIPGPIPPNVRLACAPFTFATFVAI